MHCKILKRQDSLKYRELRLESLKMHAELFGSDHETQSKLPKLFFERMIEDENENYVMIGAFSGQDLIGLCGLIPRDKKNSLEIVQMYVTSNARGKSTGQRLLSKAGSVLLNCSANTLELTVYSSNYVAIKSYESFGFNRVVDNGNEIIMTFQP